MATTQIVPAPRSFTYMGNDVHVLADSSDTNGLYAVLEMHPRPGTEPPMHYHENEDETFIVLDGSMQLTSGGEQRILGPGDSAVAKRGTPHTFKVLTPTLRTLCILRPGGFENFFRELAGDPPPTFQRIGEVAAKYGSRLAF